MYIQTKKSCLDLIKEKNENFNDVLIVYTKNEKEIIKNIVVDIIQKIIENEKKIENNDINYLVEQIVNFQAVFITIITIYYYYYYYLLLLLLL